MGNTKYLICLFSITKIYVVFLSLFSPFLLKGQEVLHFQRLSVAQNLTSQNYNYYIFKDSEGFVWISSIDGLNRFDGNEVVSYLASNEDENSLADNNANSNFFEDANKNLWFSTATAVHCYDRKNDHFQRYFINEKGKRLLGFHRLFFIDTLQNSLWVRVDDELFLMPMDTIKEPIKVGNFSPHRKWIQKKKGNSQDCFAIFRDSIGVSSAQFQHNIKDGEQSYLKKTVSLFDANDFLLKNDKNLWLVTDTGLILQHLDSLHTFQLFNRFGKNLVSGAKAIAELTDSTLLIASQHNGIYVFNIRTREFTGQIYLKENEQVGTFPYPIDEIYLDSDKTLWISSPGQGVFYTNFKKRKFKNYFQNQVEKSITVSSYVRSIAEDSLGRIWCLTQRGVDVLDEYGKPVPGFEKLKGKNTPFYNSEPFNIFCDKDQRIWVCTNSGVYLSDQKSGFEKIPTENPSDLPNIVFTCQLVSNEILFAGSENGIYKLVEEKKQLFLRPLSDSLSKDPYHHIFEDKTNHLFFPRNQKGILIIKNMEQAVPDTMVPFEGFAYDFCEDNARNRIWVASSNGLYYFDKKEGYYHFQKDTTFHIQAVKGILQDDLFNLWISTSNGLVKYNPDSGSKRNYHLSDGLQALEFNISSSLKTKSGKLAFGSVNGINIFDPNEIKDLDIKTNPTITYFEINNVAFPDYLIDVESGATNVSQLKKIELKHYQNDLNISVAALEYTDPAANEYSFKIVSRKDTITKQGKNNTFQYPNMQPGTYTLTYNATNSDGIMLDKWGKRLEIVIKPPWWETIWARILFALIGLTLIYIFYRFRVAQIRKEEEFKRKEAEYKQLVAETETAVLRLQMNPHFIFNSMNSINSYILQKDVDTASDYLNRFAKLMRMILKFAAKPLIAISDEIELLELYLQTEAMRFDKKFDYSFELKDDLDPDEFVIPTMILQPFVENAIWHGLSNKKEGEGHIKICFWQEDDSFLCSVEDNGVGRTTSNQKTKTHESKALSITEHRLQLLGKKNGVSASFEIQDLTDDNENPVGTKVVLKFPLL